MKLFFSLIVIFIFSFFSSLSAQWENVEMPAGRSGAIYSLAINGDNIFAGKSGGVFLSRDNGEHWIQINPSLPARESNAIVSSLVCSGGNVIAAFKEPGVYTSTNDGAAWNIAEINEGIVKTPQILAADGQWIVGGNSFGSTYHSLDNGRTWNHIIEMSNVAALDVQGSFGYAYSNNNGLYRSSDFGSSWIKIPLTKNITSLAVSGENLIVGVSVNYGHSFILSSTDKGSTWKDSSSLNCNSINSTIYTPDNSITKYAYAGTDSGVFRSSDGITWNPANNGLNSNLIFSLAFKMNQSGGNPVLYAGTGNGIYSSSDYGENWEAIGAPSKWIFTAYGEDLFAASSNSSFSGKSWNSNSTNNSYYTVICKSTDNGKNWQRQFSGNMGKNAQITSLDCASGTLFAGGQFYFQQYFTYQGILFSSENGGENWNNLNFDPTYLIVSLKILSSDILIGAASTGVSAPGIFHADANGNNWVKSEFPDNPFIRYFYQDGDKIYAGASVHSISSTRPPITKLHPVVFVSSDNGLKWVKIHSQLDSGTVYTNSHVDTLSYVTSFLTSGSNLLLGMRAYNFYDSPTTSYYAFGGLLYKLTGADTNWVVTDSAFIGRSVFDFESKGNYVFAATDSGVFLSDNLGSTWFDISSGMGNIYVSSLFISGDYLFASTINGTWKRPLSEITSVEENFPLEPVPSDFSLSQNYPNPFNPITQINYSIPKESLISLKVYNLLGEEVSTLFSGLRKAGKYNASFDGSNLAAGVYVFRLKADGFINTKKFVLLK